MKWYGLVFCAGIVLCASVMHSGDHVKVFFSRCNSYCALWETGQNLAIDADVRFAFKYAQHDTALVKRCVACLGYQRVNKQIIGYPGVMYKAVVAENESLVRYLVDYAPVDSYAEYVQKIFCSDVTLCEKHLKKILIQGYGNYYYGDYQQNPDETTPVSSPDSPLSDGDGDDRGPTYSPSKKQDIIKVYAHNRMVNQR